VNSPWIDLQDPLVVRKGGSPASRFREARALRAFSAGSVQLLQGPDDEGAFTMERVIPGVTLAQRFSLFDDHATVIMGELIQRLHTSQRIVESEVAQIPPLAGIARPLAQCEDARMPKSLQERALAILTDLVADERQVILHGDLHQGNVLWSDRRFEWVAIDPHGWRGDPCLDAAVPLCTPHMLGVGGDARGCAGEPLLRTAERRMTILSEIIECDPERLRQWVFVGCLIAEARMIEQHGLVHGAPLSLAEALAQRRSA